MHSTNVMTLSYCQSPAMLPSEGNYTEILLDNLKRFNRSYQPLHGYFCLVLCTFGLFTNALNAIVLTRPNMRTSVNMVLAAIAFCDMGTMGSYLVYVTRFYVIHYDTTCVSDVYTFGWMSFILFHSLWSIMLHSASLWLAVLLAVMRLAVIRRSEFSYKLLRASDVWKWILYIYAPLVVLCLPVIFTNSIVEVKLPVCHSDHQYVYANATVSSFTVSPSDWALRHNCLLLKCTLWITGVAFKMLPCLVLFVAILGLMKTLHKAKLRKQRMMQRKTTLKKNSVKHFSSRTTRMLVAILSIFVATELPQALLATVSGVYTDDVYFKIYPLVGDVLDLLSLLNSSVNFLLYCSMSSRFRTVFTRLITPTIWRFRRRYSASENDMISCPMFESTLNGFTHLSSANFVVSRNMEKTLSAVLNYSPDIVTMSPVKPSVSFSKTCS